MKNYRSYNANKITRIANIIDSMCFSKSSKKDEDCSINKVHIKYLKLCPSGHLYCRKAVYVYYFMDSYNGLIMRECAKSRNSQKKCYQGRYTRDSYQLICECVGYGCNLSQQCSPNLQIYFLCIVFVITSYFLLPGMI
ncbi:PREDICTED: uncharacterized protein LOC105460332 isoform X2 [Wasmannia auropunctata]|uniref:uncharacterized protein LOC105460332 isoform X2 n=1 Tax=Wasmannia auropunctata TaxID=64793 RepID=UPI0005EEF751|nr:PREDICTED: uncharacterized protein LOC105460332 isoform X2 [Wasmannia auropunctata]